MDYERKYKEALKWMQSLYDGLHGATKEEAEHYFPELREDDDERVRKGLIKAVSRIFEGYKLFDTDVTREEALAWLEKQGEKKSADINGEDYGIDGLYHAIKILEGTVGKVIDYQSDDGILEHKAAINAVKELYEKQRENKPTDKVEPKFKVGDWITNGDYTWEVTDIAELDYVLRSQDGNIVDDTISYVDKYFHLWTIQDSMDGDMLIKEETEEPFIHNGNRGTYLPEFLGAYCGIENGEFKPNGSPYYWGRPACPATKEQRDLLFQKMKEEGYEWDANKKELKKIEQKTLDVDKVIEWLKNTINEVKERFGIHDLYYSTQLVLPYNSIEDLINDFKEDFGL